MKKIFSYCFDKWWKPILLWFISCIMIIFSRSIANTIFTKLAFLIFALGLIATFVSSFYLVIKKKWLKAILTFCVFGGTMLIVLVFLSITLAWNSRFDSDRFGDNLKIPTNIQINNPIDPNLGDSIMNRKVIKRDFQLYNGLQPGIYSYDFWTGKIDRGTIYLRAYEITQNIELSSDRLLESSSVKVYNPTNNIIKFGMTHHFTIYEGDWGKPYTGKFEVWFKPENGTEERKLFTKNYKIEGWMR